MQYDDVLRLGHSCLAIVGPLALAVSQVSHSSDGALYLGVSADGMAIREDPIPIPARPGKSATVEVVVALPAGGVLAITHSQGSPQEAWQAHARGQPVMRVALPTDPNESVLCGTPTRSGALLGTTVTLIQVSDALASRFEDFFDLRQRSYIAPPPARFCGRVEAIAADAGDEVWLALGRGSSRHYVFSADPSRWVKEFLGQRLAKPLPQADVWWAPANAIAADPRRAGLWTYGVDREGRTGIWYRDPSLPEPYALKDPRPATPNGVQVPRVADPHLAADTPGRVWLTGDEAGAAKVYVFDGQQIADNTPPADLLKGRHFTQLLVDKSDRLYVATDGAGVLVCDGNRWAAHPINEHLPTVEGTDLKPVSCMAIDTEGRLWVGMDNNIICWQKQD